MNKYPARFSDHKLVDLSKALHQYRIDNDARTSAIEERQAETVAKLNKLVQNTSDIIQLQSDLAGAARLGVRIQRFGVWLIKWPLIGTGLYTAYEWIIQQLPK